METLPFLLERSFNAPVEKVWKAITVKDEMKAWYFDLPEFKAEKGFAFSFTGGHEDGIQYLHLCEVTDVVPLEKLQYSWRYEGYEGISHVTFELMDKGDTTLLRLIHEGMESFPQNNPDFDAGNFGAGRDQIINTALSKYLEEARIN